LQHSKTCDLPTEASSIHDTFYTRSQPFLSRPSFEDGGWLNALTGADENCLGWYGLEIRRRLDAYCIRTRRHIQVVSPAQIGTHDVSVLSAL